MSHQIDFESGPDTLLEDDGFRITRYSIEGHQSTYTFVEHLCAANKEDPTAPSYGWKWYESDPKEVGFECPGCTRRPPEGLQAVFWFVGDDSTEVRWKRGARDWALV